MSTKILVAHHKYSHVFKNEVFLPIQVGRANSPDHLDMIGDDSGDNISHLNKYYCELTAVYWAWKNLKEAKHIGLCHYRRYLIKPNVSISLELFAKKIILKGLRSLGINPGRDIANFYRINNFKRIESLLIETTQYIDNLCLTNRYEMIIPYKYYFLETNSAQHFDYIGKHYTEKLKEIVTTNFPVYASMFTKSLEDNFIYPANIFVFKREIFDEYCSFIFPVLEEHVSFFLKNEPEEKYNRVAGFMSELVTNAFIRYKIETNTSFAELPSTFSEM